MKPKTLLCLALVLSGGLLAKMRISKALMLQLLLCGGCAIQGSSQLGLYPRSDFSEADPAEQVAPWTSPPNNPFEPKKAQAELLPILYFGMHSMEKSARMALFSHLEIQACARIPVTVTYKTGSWSGTNTVAVMVSRSDDEIETEGRLVLVVNGTLLAAHYLGQGMNNQYSLTLVHSSFERNPLLLLFRNEGGNSRNFSYELYRVEDDDLRCLWKWDEDGETTSTAHQYSYSNLDFSGLTSGKKNEVRVYTTTGYGRVFGNMTERDLVPLHKKTSFSWSKSAQRFVPESIGQVLLKP